MRLVITSYRRIPARPRRSRDRTHKHLGGIPSFRGRSQTRFGLACRRRPLIHNDRYSRRLTPRFANLPNRWRAFCGDRSSSLKGSRGKPRFKERRKLIMIGDAIWRSLSDFEKNNPFAFYPKQIELPSCFVICLWTAGNFSCQFCGEFDNL